VRQFRKAALVGAVLAAIAAAVLWFNARNVGVAIDSYKGVPIYDNGPLVYKSHGRNYSPSGYYYGQKWQCVEFVKRFFDQAKAHQMPDVWGNAKDFFDPAVAQGGMNNRRGLRQYYNGSNAPPVADDLFVFSGRFGHVGIVSEVTSNSVEIVQQNIYRKPRARFPLTVTNGCCFVGSANLLGWLRKDSL
jgi:surface antigen